MLIVLSAEWFDNATIQVGSCDRTRSCCRVLATEPTDNEPVLEPARFASSSRVRPVATAICETIRRESAALQRDAVIPRALRKRAKACQSRVSVAECGMDGAAPSAQMPAVRYDLRSYLQGVRDAYAGKPNRAESVADKLAYASGRVEGEAARLQGQSLEQLLEKARLPRLANNGGKQVP